MRFFIAGNNLTKAVCGNHFKDSRFPKSAHTLKPVYGFLFAWGALLLGSKIFSLRLPRIFGKESGMEEEKEWFNLSFVVTYVFVVAFWFMVLFFFCFNAHAEEVNMSRIAMIESNGNPLAWNKAEDGRGLFQVNPICLREWNNFHPRDQHTPDDLFRAHVNAKIADWYINRRIPAMIKHYGKPDTIENRIIAYNAGISYVVNGKEIPQITKNYIKKYRGEK